MPEMHQKRRQDMKRKISLLISLIMIIGMSSIAHAAIEPAFYDFEDYKTSHKAPEGFNGRNEWTIYPEQVDEDHGTSLKLEDTCGLEYVFSEPITSGKFLMSFEAYFKNKGTTEEENEASTAGMRMYIPKIGATDAFSVFRFSPGGVQSANTGLNAWEFTKIADIKTKKWYQIDLLFDMDQARLSYYIDGVKYDEVKGAFSEIGSFILTFGELKEKGYIYMDNMSFKYVSPGSFSTNYLRNQATPGNDEVKLNFTDVMDKTTLTNAKVYSMGSNILNYAPEEISCSVADTSIKGMTLKLGKAFEAGKIYKVELDGVKTLFGEDLTNNEEYFTASGALCETPVLNADFSTLPEGGMNKPIKPTTDIEWTTGGRKALVQGYPKEAVEMIRFGANKGDSTFTKNQTSLSRIFSAPYSEFAIFEYKMKSVNGIQNFKIADSDDNIFTAVTVTNDGIYCGETKLSDFVSGEWFTIKIEADFDGKTAVIKKDGNVVAENIDISSVKDAKKVEFSQENYAETFSDTSIPKENYAESYLAYFKVFEMKEGISASFISFEDEDGNAVYPEKNIPSDVTKVKIRFSDKVDSSTLADGLTLTIDGKDAEYTGSYDDNTNTYTLNLKQYLFGNAEYKLEVNDKLKDLLGNSISAYSGSFETDKGFVEAKDITLEKVGNNVTLGTEIIHTNKTCPDMYLVFTAYKGKLMIDMQYQKIEPTEDERKITVTKNYEAPEGTTSVSGFLWDGFDTMIPMTRTKAAN